MTTLIVHRPVVPPVLVARIVRAKDWDWVRLRTFACVVERKSYGKAADELGLSGATAVRKRILGLENLLGQGQPLTLFRCDGTGQKLTEAGRQLWQLVQCEFNTKK